MAPVLPSEGRRVPDGLGALRKPPPKRKGPRGPGSLSVICQPQAFHSASVILSPLSPMLLVVAMVTSLQDEILVSTRTGVLAGAVRGGGVSVVMGICMWAEGTLRLEHLAHTCT